MCLQSRFNRVYRHGRKSIKVNLRPHSTPAQDTWVVPEGGGREGVPLLMGGGGRRRGGSRGGERGSAVGRRPGQTLRQNQVTLSHIHLWALCEAASGRTKAALFWTALGESADTQRRGSKRKARRRASGAAHAKETVEGRVAQCD